MLTQNTTAFTIAYIAAASAVSLPTPDPLDGLGPSHYAIYFGFALGGWACTQLTTLALWVDATRQQRLEIVQKFIIAICAGIGGALIVRAGWPWVMDGNAPKMAVRGAAFIAAYGGARTLSLLFDTFIEGMNKLRAGRPPTGGTGGS